MIGQSSSRATWWLQKVYQTTTSLFSIGRSARVHSGRPSLPGRLVGVLAGGVALVGAKRGHPQVALDEPGPEQQRESSRANGTVFSPGTRR